MGRNENRQETHRNQANFNEFLDIVPIVSYLSITALRRKQCANANAINDLAGHVQLLNYARKLVDHAAAEFSNELPLKWATRSIRNPIARAEFEFTADPSALIPEQHVVDVWNDYLE